MTELGGLTGAACGERSGGKEQGARQAVARPRRDVNLAPGKRAPALPIPGRASRSTAQRRSGGTNTPHSIDRLPCGGGTRVRACPPRRHAPARTRARVPSRPWHPTTGPATPRSSPLAARASRLSLRRLPGPSSHHRSGGRRIIARAGRGIDRAFGKARMMDRQDPLAHIANSHKTYYGIFCTGSNFVKMQRFAARS